MESAKRSQLIVKLSMKRENVPSAVMDIISMTTFVLSTIQTVIITDGLMPQENGTQNGHVDVIKSVNVAIRDIT